MSLTQEQTTRAYTQLTEAAGEHGITHAAIEAALDELESIAISHALWQLWNEGHTSINWTVKDGVCWTSITPYREANDAELARLRRVNSHEEFLDGPD